MREAVRFGLAKGARLVALVAVMLMFESLKVVSQGVPDMTTEQELTELNIKIAEMERQRNKAAEDFFNEVLSDELIFRRVSGAVVGKKGFLDGFQGPYPFTDLKPKDIKIGWVDGLQNRALVTLVIVGKREDGTEGRYRNVRLFSKAVDSKYKWRLEFWYNYELTSL
jgi:hypothetical protein